MYWSALVSLVALSVTALTLWIGYRERGSAYRNLIYQRQVEAYSAFVRAIWALYEKTVEILPVNLASMNESLLRQANEAVAAEYDFARRTFYENRLFSQL